MQRAYDVIEQVTARLLAHMKVRDSSISLLCCNGYYHLEIVGYCHSLPGNCIRLTGKVP